MDEAKSLCDRALAQAPANSEIIYNAGMLYRDDGQPEKPSPYSRKHSRYVQTHRRREVR